jgi:hypothetical protein
MHHVDRAVAEARRNPNGIASKMVDRCVTSQVSGSPSTLELAFNSLNARPGFGAVSGTRIIGADNILTRAEEEQYFGAYVYARQELRILQSTGLDWVQVVDDEWGCFLFRRAVWFRHVLWQLNWSLSIGWFAKNRKACGQCMTQDEDDLLTLTHMKVLDCVDLFNPTVGRKFSTYAVNSLETSVKTQSKREVMRKRNTPVASIFGSEESRQVVNIRDRRAVSTVSEMSVGDKLDWIRTKGTGLRPETRRYIEHLIEGKPSDSVVSPAEALSELRKLMAKGEFPCPM